MTTGNTKARTMNKLRSQQPERGTMFGQIEPPPSDTTSSSPRGERQMTTTRPVPDVLCGQEDPETNRPTSPIPRQMMNTLQMNSPTGTLTASYPYGPITHEHFRRMQNAYMILFPDADKATISLNPAVR